MRCRAEPRGPVPRPKPIWVLRFSGQVWRRWGQSCCEPRAPHHRKTGSSLLEACQNRAATPRLQKFGAIHRVSGAGDNAPEGYCRCPTSCNLPFVHAQRFHFFIIVIILRNLINGAAYLFVCFFALDQTKAVSGGACSTPKGPNTKRCMNARIEQIRAFGSTFLTASAIFLRWLGQDGPSLPR